MKQLIKNIISPFYFYIKSKNERVFYKLLQKYGGIRRYRYIKNIKFLDFIVDVSDGLSFCWQFKEIFEKESYAFKSNNNDPIIYDCGANMV